MTEPDAREIARLRAVLQEICEHEECCCEGGFFDRFCTLCTARGALEDHSGGRQPAVEGHHGDAETLPAAIKRLEGLIAGTDNLVTDANWDTARVEFGRADIDALKLVVKTLKRDDTSGLLVHSSKLRPRGLIFGNMPTPMTSASKRRGTDFTRCIRLASW